jgi:hypothetical protein
MLIERDYMKKNARSSLDCSDLTIGNKTLLILLAALIIGLIFSHI